MNSIQREMAAMDSMLQMIRNAAMGGVVLFCLVGVDLILGARLMNLLGRTFNKRFDLDKLVLLVLTGFRQGTEAKVMNVDEAMQKARARVFVGVMLLIPAFLLITFVVSRR